MFRHVEDVAGDGVVVPALRELRLGRPSRAVPMSTAWAVVIAVEDMAAPLVGKRDGGWLDSLRVIRDAWKVPRVRWQRSRALRARY